MAWRESGRLLVVCDQVVIGRIKDILDIAVLARRVERHARGKILGQVHAHRTFKHGVVALSDIEFEVAFALAEFRPAGVGTDGAGN